MAREEIVKLFQVAFNNGNAVFPPSGGEFLNKYLLAQLTPRVVRNVYSGYQGDPHIITQEDKLKMLMDYQDVLHHDTGTLRDVFGPLMPP